MRHMKNVIKRTFGLTAAVCILLLAFSGCTKTPYVGQNSSTGSIDESSTNGESSADSSTPASDSSKPTSDNESSVDNSYFDGIEHTFQDFDYGIINGKAAIIRYNGDAENVVIPSEIDGIPVFSIYLFAFQNKRNLVSVTIPDSVIDIERSAFGGCSSLTSVNLPSNLETLGFSAFASCTSLTSIKIPKSIVTWEAGVFYNCTSLTNVEFEEGITKVGLEQTFSNCTSLTSFEFPEGITEVPKKYFENCTSLTSVTLPDSVTALGYGAFTNTALVSIIIPENVHYLDMPFYYCKTLSSIKFEGDAPTVERDTFSLIKSPDLVIYYHEDKEGWTSPTFRNVPTEIW